MFAAFCVPFLRIMTQKKVVIQCRLFSTIAKFKMRKRNRIEPEIKKITRPFLRKNYTKVVRQNKVISIKLIYHKILQYSFVEKLIFH